eukprot:Transcript_17646.p1 GENE.Transcript_17646~~Transcript_17646.p1  ORF type:complete len:186 (-),score=11.95 Transcript_17646:492-989(-)
MGLTLAEGRALALNPHQPLRAVGEEVPLPRGIAAVRLVHQRGVLTPTKAPPARSAQHKKAARAPIVSHSLKMSQPSTTSYSPSAAAGAVQSSVSHLSHRTGESPFRSALEASASASTGLRSVSTTSWRTALQAASRRHRRHCRVRAASPPEQASERAAMRGRDCS